MRQLIQQGAEAKIFLDGDKIIKERIVKGYRHPTIDLQIRTRRTRHEAKILCKAKELGVNVPVVFNVDEKFRPKSKFVLEMEFIEGDKLSDCLNGYDEAKQFWVMEKLGCEVAKLHENDLIHADLTTSNVILKGEEVFIIDFGLGFVSSKIEDKAVDLHLIRRALEAKHFMNYEVLFEKFLKGYEVGCRESEVGRQKSEVRSQTFGVKSLMFEKVSLQLKKVETRGRYK